MDVGMKLDHGVKLRDHSKFAHEFNMLKASLYVFLQP